MELSEGISFVKPPKRANTIGSSPTLEQLQRRLPQADAPNALAVTLNSQTTRWGMEIWQNSTTQQSFQTLKAAVCSYNAEANAADLARIQEKSATFIEVREAAFAAQIQRHKDQNKALRKMRLGLDRFCQVLHSFCPVVDVLSNASPESAQLAWGVIRFLLIMNVNSVELKEAVLQTLGDIGEQFDMLRCFLGLYPTEAMTQHVCSTYRAFNEFLTEAVKYYKENSIKRFFKNVTHPYAVRFQPFLQTVEQHVTRVNGLVALGQGRAIAENITITKQTRNLIAMSNWKQDETNQAVKQLATLFYEERKRVEWQTQADEAARRREEPDPLQTARDLLSKHNFADVLKFICQELSTQEDSGSGELSRLALAIEAQGGDSRVYERLGLMDNTHIVTWAECRRSSFLWIDGFLSRPDWTTQLVLDVISAAKRAGNVVLFFMCGEHGEDSKLHRPTAWIKRFIGQLFAQRPEHFTFEKQCEIITNLILVKDLEGVWEVLANCIRDINFGFIYIVLDNIDNAFSSTENIAELQEFLDALDKLSKVENRTIKFLATTRRSVLKDFKIPSTMVVVPVTPFAKLSNAHRHNNILVHCRRPKKRIADRLPDRDTDHDLTLSDDSSWNDDVIEEMLETSDDEGVKVSRLKERRKKQRSWRRVSKTKKSDDSLDEDSLSSDEAGPVAQPRSGKWLPKLGKAMAKSKDKDASSSEDSLDSLDSLVSLDSLDKALKTSSDEDGPVGKLGKGVGRVGHENEGLGKSKKGDVGAKGDSLSSEDEDEDLS